MSKDYPGFTPRRSGWRGTFDVTDEDEVRAQVEHARRLGLDASEYRRRALRAFREGGAMDAAVADVLRGRGWTVEPPEGGEEDG